MRHLQSLACMLTLALAAHRAFAQGCPPEWQKQFGPPVIEGSVHALAEFDRDGTGPLKPLVFAGGDITKAGGVPVMNLAAWDGGYWAAAGNFNGRVLALASYDPDGTGPAPASLYAGGEFTMVDGQPADFIARWDGQAWVAVGGGMNAEVRALHVWDEDGSGPLLPALYVGGHFTMAGGQAATYVARWDGASWSPVGGGMDYRVYAFTTFDDDGVGPNKPALFVGGRFNLAGSTPAAGVAKWDGAAWSALGSGVAGVVGSHVRALCPFDPDGGGPAPQDLYVGGYFESAGNITVHHIARWSESQWSAVGIGLSGSVFALAVLDEDGGGPSDGALYAGGAFPAGSTLGEGLVRWDGSGWSGLGVGVTGGAVEALCEVAVESIGPRTLFVGGTFTSVLNQFGSGLARWNGSHWSAVGNGVSAGVRTFCAFDDDGPGPSPAALYAGGNFGYAGGAYTGPIARWSGSSWAPVPGNPLFGGGEVSALAAFDEDATGPTTPALFIGRISNQLGLLKWDGRTWQTFKKPFGGNYLVSALAVFDEDANGPLPESLFVGGQFKDGANKFVTGIVRWNGAAFSNVGSGIDGDVAALSVADLDGTGPASATLCAAGGFGVLTWDGNAWSSLSNGPDDVYVLAAFDDDGPGPKQPRLFVGHFDSPYLSAWNGSTWSSVSGFDGIVRALVVHDSDGDGPGVPELFVGGDFTTAGGVPSQHVARWNGSSWAALGSGTTDSVRAFGSFSGKTPGSPTELYVGLNTSFYTLAGTAVVQGLAVWMSPGSFPMINDPPQSSKVPAGTATSLAVQVNASEPVSFQWRKGGQNLVNGGNISGATTDTLLIDPAMMADTGSYDVVITNPCGSLTSPAAMLTVVCEGDVNGDNKVNQQDIGILLGVYGICEGQPGWNPAANLAPNVPGPQCIDQADIGVLLAFYGQVCP